MCKKFKDFIDAFDSAGMAVVLYVSLFVYCSTMWGQGDLAKQAFAALVGALTVYRRQRPPMDSPAPAPPLDAPSVA